MENRILVALDIGTTMIRLAVAEVDENWCYKNLIIKDAISEGVVNGKVTDEQKLGTIVDRLILEMEDEIGRDIDVPICVSINSHSLGTITSKYTLSIKQKYSDINPLEGHIINSEDVYDQIDAAVSAACMPANYREIYAVDYEHNIDSGYVVDSPIGLTCKNRLDSSVFVVFEDGEIFESLDKAIDPDKFTIEPYPAAIAVSNSVVNDRDKEVGIAVIDFGFNTTTLTVYTENKINLVATFKFGSDTITQEIKNRINIPKEIAEEVKIIHGMCHLEDIINPNEKTYNDTTYGVIKIPPFGANHDMTVPQKHIDYHVSFGIKEMFEEIRLKFEKYDFYEKINGGIVLTGNGSNIEGIEKLVSEILGKKTIIGNPLKCLNELENGDKTGSIYLGEMNTEDNCENIELIEKLSDYANPKYATVIGLIQLAKNSEQEYELLRNMEESTERNTSKDSTLKKIIEIIKRFI